MHLSGVLYPKILRNSNDALQDQKIIYEPAPKLKCARLKRVVATILK